MRINKVMICSSIKFSQVILYGKEWSSVENLYLDIGGVKLWRKVKYKHVPSHNHEFSDRGIFTKSAININGKQSTGTVEDWRQITH